MRCSCGGYSSGWGVLFYKNGLEESGVKSSLRSREQHLIDKDEKENDIGT